MANWRGIARGNFPDARIRRNWNKLATFIQEMFSKAHFKFGSNGEVQIKGGPPQKWNAYDKTGAFVVPSVPGTVPYDTERVNSDSVVFTDLTDGEVTIDGNGDPFLFTATVTVQHVDDVDASWQGRIWLEENTGSGFEEVPGSSVNLGTIEDLSGGDGVDVIARGISVDIAAASGLNILSGKLNFQPSLLTVENTVDPATDQLVFMDNNFGLVARRTTLQNLYDAAAKSSGGIFILDSNGLVIGHTAQIVAGNTSELQVLGTSGPDATAIIARFDNSAVGPGVDFVKSRDATIGSHTIVADNDACGALTWYPDDGVDYATQAAQFRAEVDDPSPAAGDIGMAFRWAQMPGGGGVLRETMRLSAAGNLSILGTVDGRDVAVDGTKLDAIDDDAMLSPIGLSIANLTDVTVNTNGTSYFLYVGRVLHPITKALFLTRVVTAFISGGVPTWAEIGVFTGEVEPNGNAELTRVGSTDISGVFNTTGIKIVNIPLSGVSVGDGLWLAWGNRSITTLYELRAMIADDIQSGVYQSIIGRISTLSSPVTVSLESTTKKPAWARLSI